VRGTRACHKYTSIIVSANTPSGYSATGYSHRKQISPRFASLCIFISYKTARKLRLPVAMVSRIILQRASHESFPYVTRVNLAPRATRATKRKSGPGSRFARSSRAPDTVISKSGAQKLARCIFALAFRVAHRGRPPEAACDEY